MKSIKIHFKKIKEKNPYWSSIICFIKAIRTGHYHPETIKNAFNELVDKDDFLRGEKIELFSWLNQFAIPQQNPLRTQILTLQFHSKQRKHQELTPVASRPINGLFLAHT